MLGESLPATLGVPVISLSIWEQTASSIYIGATRLEFGKSIFIEVHGKILKFKTSKIEMYPQILIFRGYTNIIKSHFPKSQTSAHTQMPHVQAILPEQ